MNGIIELYGDIETIPSQRPDVIDEIRFGIESKYNSLIEQVRCPANYKKAETIDEWEMTVRPKLIGDLVDKCEAEIAESYHATGLDPAYGQIAVIALAVGDDEPDAIYVEHWQEPGAERRVLATAFQWIDAHIPRARPVLEIGFNWVEFDRRRLQQRSMINGVLPHYLFQRETKPWEDGIVYDCMQKFCGPRDRVSMKKLCRAFNVPAKQSGIDGSQVWDYVRSGRIAEVAEYCRDDVRDTRRLYRAMRNLRAYSDFLVKEHEIIDQSNPLLV